MIMMIGKTPGHFTLEAQIGKGGMGIVKNWKLESEGKGVKK